MIIEKWANHVVETNFTELDVDTIESAKLRIIDVVGCMVAGANAPGCNGLLDLMKEWDGAPQATVVVHGIKAPAHNVAMLNSIMARSYDFGPVIPYVEGKPLPGHISESTIPTALSVAEWQKRTGKEFLTALILGDDIIARVMAACDRVVPGGWEMTGIENVFGTSVIAGKLLGLTSSQLVYAFGIGLNQMGGTMQNIYDGAMTFKFPQGLSARAGVFSGELAKKGYLAIKDSLFSKYGFFPLYYPNLKKEILTRDLGKKYYSDSCFKIFPSCGATQATIECALNLVREHEISANDIKSIIIEVTPSHLSQPLGQPFKIGEFPQGDAAFNLYYVAANVLLRKDLTLEHYTDQMVRDPNILDLTQKTTILGTFPDSKHTTIARLTVKMKDGREFQSFVDGPRGSPLAKPITRNEIEVKFKNNLAFTKNFFKTKAEEILEMIYNLEKVDDISQLMSLLISPRRTAL